MKLWWIAISGMIVLFCCNSSTTGKDFHDFHISKTQVAYDAATQEWQISLHVFIDDLEEALRQQGSPTLHLGSKKEAETADDYIFKYLQRHFSFTQERDPLSYQWLGKEVSEDLNAFWIHLYIPSTEPTNELTIKNQLLMDIFSDQQNMLQLIGPKAEEHYVLFHQDRTTIKIQFGA